MTDTFDRTQLDGKDRGQLSEIAVGAGREGGQPHAQGRARRRDRVRAPPVPPTRRPNGVARPTAAAQDPLDRRRAATTSRRSPTSRTRSRPTSEPVDDMALIRPPAERRAGNGNGHGSTPHGRRLRRPTTTRRAPHRVVAPERRRRRRRTPASDDDAGERRRRTATAHRSNAGPRRRRPGQPRRRRRRRGRDRDRPGGAPAAGARPVERRTQRASREIARRLHRRPDRARGSARPARRGLRLPAHERLPRRPQRRVRVGVAGAPLRSAQGRLREGRDPSAREHREVPGARARRPHQRHDARRGARAACASRTSRRCSPTRSCASSSTTTRARSPAASSTSSRRSERASAA